MFPLPRVLYAMSSDGILYKFLKKIHPRTKTPLIATLLSGLLSGIMALVFNLHQLIDMMSIGTLLAYTIVSVCILVLRYQNDPLVGEVEMTLSQAMRQIFNLNFIKHPNSISSNIAKYGVIFYCILAVCFCGLYSHVQLEDENRLPQIILLLIAFAMLLLIIVIARQPAADVKLTFKVPMVPLIPCLSIFINLYLMFQLDYETWIRFLVWVIIGKMLFYRELDLIRNVFVAAFCKTNGWLFSPQSRNIWPRFSTFLVLAYKI